MKRVGASLASQTIENIIPTLEWGEKESIMAILRRSIHYNITQHIKACLTKGFPKVNNVFDIFTEFLFHGVNINHDAHLIGIIWMDAHGTQLRMEIRIFGSTKVYFIGKTIHTQQLPVKYKHSVQWFIENHEIMVEIGAFLIHRKQHLDAEWHDRDPKRVPYKIMKWLETPFTYENVCNN